MLVTLLIIFGLGFPWVQCTDANFSVSVVEYSPYLDESFNLDKYSEIIRKSGDADFLVFPEDTLTSRGIEVLNTESVDCANVSSGDVISLLGCLAKETQTIIVINLPERVNCSVNTDGCGPRDYLLYNTNVIFGKNGTVIGKYRKFNLFGEIDKNTTEKADLTILDTDKGKFGVFTCFDLMFRDPPLQLVKLGVQNFFFPTKWYSELPFLTALQAQQMWAYGNNVNFFSAGANNLKLGSGGSGIFMGNSAPKQLTLNPELKAGEYEILSSRNLSLTINETEEETDKIASKLDLMFLKQDTISEYQSAILDSTKTIINTTLCDKTNSICCNFDVTLKNITQKTNSSNHYYHRFVAFSGVRSFSGVYNGGVELCGIISCIDNKSVNSCNQRYPNYNNISWPTVFESVKISATFDNSDSKMQFPNSLLSSLRPLSPLATSWDRKILGKTVNVQFTLKEPQSRLMTFAIYGRDYSRDGANKINHGSRVNINTVLLTFLTILCILTDYKY